MMVYVPGGVLHGNTRSIFIDLSQVLQLEIGEVVRMVQYEVQGN